MKLLCRVVINILKQSMSWMQFAKTEPLGNYRTGDGLAEVEGRNHQAK